MVVGFTYRGHQILLLVYGGDVRPVRLLAYDLFTDVVLHRGTISPQRNGYYNVQECDRGTSGECARLQPCVSLRR
jgi:hypothetical protein